VSGKIYLLQEDGTLQSLEERAYASEALLQRLLEDYPDLLAGEQIDDAAPRRWLLVGREVAVPVEQAGGAGMSLDHLFLDQDAVPTLVEVKRSTDTRIRREIVGQLLDYAAHAVALWSGETIRARFEARCEARGTDPAALVAQLLEMQLEDGEGIEEFWGQVETNLQAGRMRLLFVADHIPPELKRVVEFLNRFMNPVEVLAVEISQYVGHGLQSLVPRVIGQSAEALAKRARGRSSGRQWDEATFFEALETGCGTGDADAARRILAWAGEKVTSIYWGKGRRSGSFVPVVNQQGTDHPLFAVWTYGTVEIYFYWYQFKPPFDSEDRRRELARRLTALDGVTLPDDAITRRPGIPLSALMDGDTVEAFLEIFDWVVEEIRDS
jgi:hypothetical protein